MRKLFIFLFKYLIPLAIVAVPIVKSFETTTDYAKGVAFLVLLVLLFVFIKKIYKDIVFKEQHERLVDRAISFWTNFKYEMSQIIFGGLVFGLLNVISLYIGGINKFILYIMASYFVGAVIKISGSKEFIEE